MFSNIDFVLEDAIFDKICNINSITYEIIDEFIKNYISKHPNNDLLLRNLSNLYVLYGMLVSDNCCEENEKKWKDILDEEQYKIIQKNNYYILGFIWINKKKSKNKKIHYIEFIDTRLRGHNLANYMINKYNNFNYSNNENQICLPYEIIDTSVEYWKNYFELKYDLTTKEDYKKFIIDMKINEDHLKWSNLLKIL